MTTLPHDIQDLYVAPVLLAIDAQITELGLLDVTGLALAVGVESDLPDWSRTLREEALLRTVSHLVNLHGWTLSWDVRGIRLTHDERSFVLGVPPVFTEYLDGTVS